MKIAVVIAALDERENAGPLCRRLLATLSAVPGTSFELIFVVEGSDGTEEALRELAGQAPEIRVLRPSAARGLGAAFRLGFLSVPEDADAVVTMDADLSHAPEDIPGLLGALDAGGAEIVVGSRLTRGGADIDTPRWKRWLSLRVNGAMRRLFKTRIADQTSGFRVYRAKVLRGLPFASDGFAFLPEMLTLALAQGHRVVEHPITYRYRRRGRSKMLLGSTALSYLGFFARTWRPASRVFPVGGSAGRVER